MVGTGASGMPLFFVVATAVVVAMTVLYLQGVRAAWDGSARPLRVRLLALCGLLVTVGAILLGFAPSYFIVVAVGVLPAPFLFATAVFRPQSLDGWPKLRRYLHICVIASSLCWVSEFIWLAMR